ncbi:MAG: cupredoxin domain-containing protein [Alphaproteobacteria bacterium]
MNRGGRLARGVTVIVAVTAVVLGLPGARPEAQQLSVIVDARDFSFEPRDVMIPAGATVRWVNRDAFPHSVSIAGNPPASSRGTIAPGGEHTFVFRQAGRFTYRCGVHPTMLGEILVTGM